MAKRHAAKTRQPTQERGIVAELMTLLDPAAEPSADGAIRETRLALASLAVIVLLLLVPFANRAFHVDDPLFVWAARNIQLHPANPYSFNVNWYSTTMAMADVTKNPPIASYYIAIAAAVLGWSEVALHVAFMLPALAVAIGTFMVARRCCRRPLLAALAAVLTPVFAVSSATVMSDVMMLAFWVWAVHLWMAGLDRKSHVMLAGAGVLAALSALSKYFGMTLIPLLLCYAIVRERKARWWIAYLLVPVTMLAGYQWLTLRLYGRGLLLDAAEYATGSQAAFRTFAFAKAFVGFVFTGGCVASALLFARQLWSRVALLAAVAVVAIVSAIIWSMGRLGAVPLPAGGGLLAFQLGLWSVAGAGVLALAVMDLYNRRDAESWLLFLWVTGTFIFATFVNWSTNGRSILPMVVPAGILIARQLERRSAMPLPAGGRRTRMPATVIPLLAAAAISIAVTAADSALADTARAGAATIHDRYANTPRPVWFQGHWGFQYYMEQFGAKAVDVRTTEFEPGDIVAVPTTNTNLVPMPSDWATVREVVELPSSGWLATMNSAVGAGFYADLFGPLPFAVGSVPRERFIIYQVGPPATR